MLDSSKIEGTDIVTVTYEGSAGADEMVGVREKLNAVVAERGSAKLLVEVQDVDLGRIEPKALWEELKTAHLVDDIDRLAIVADSGAIEKLAGVADNLSSIEVRSFDSDQRDDAVIWLQAS
jgi:hypothetical protein